MSERYVKLSDAQDIVESSCHRCPYAEKDGCNVVSELYKLPTVELPHWHDLRKNPEDLPEYDFTDVLVTDGNGNYAIGYVVKGHWVTDELIDENVVKWMELPKNEV